MNYHELIDQVNAKLIKRGITPPENMTKILEATAEAVREGLLTHDTVTILGLGQMVVSKNHSNYQVRFRKSRIFKETERAIHEARVQTTQAHC